MDYCDFFRQATGKAKPYLILARHGKVRMILRAMPNEPAAPDVKRFARGVHEGDMVSGLEFDGEHSAATTVKLALMKVGLGAQGPSWSERALRLLDQWGPFRLPWLETLVRLADWRASAAEQFEPLGGGLHNDVHELDRRHQTLAQPVTGGTETARAGESATQGGTQYGLRGRAGGSGDARSRTQPPHAATRYVDTTLGILSYAELAPHLGRRVEQTQYAIRQGELDARAFDESPFLDLHRRICGELMPGFAGRWRSQDVVANQVVITWQLKAQGDKPDVSCSATRAKTRLRSLAPYAGARRLRARQIDCRTLRGRAQRAERTMVVTWLVDHGFMERKDGARAEAQGPALLRAACSAPMSRANTVMLKARTTPWPSMRSARTHRCLNRHSPQIREHRHERRTPTRRRTDAEL